MVRKEFTNGRELCRPGITRFATHFLSLQCLLKFKKELRQMFTCDKWLSYKLAKSVIGKEVAKLMLEDRDFWLQCQHVVKLSEPLVRVLRLTEGDEKPSIGYLYEAIDKAKETIKSNLKNRLSLYMQVLRVIDARWDKQISSPLHSAGCFLNPGIFFQALFQEAKGALVSDDYMQDLICSQLEEYKQATGDFGMAIAVRQCEKLNPVAWWEQFGNNCPDLQKFAICVLSQCTSATGCERNWSVFEFIHSKKHNRLEHKRLNDLVFVHYNLKLRERAIGRTKEALDPVSLDNIDVLADWVSEEESVTTQEDLDNDGGWDVLQPEPVAVNLEDEEVHNEDEEDALHDIPSQYDREFGGERDPYQYIELQDSCEFAVSVGNMTPAADTR
ncbi:hypothetical protein RJ640_023678 [Escallonia rubra]|uniref:HAT C-terminal dimerisation domain-containing protein n=1 Tax=Escallonia rubra TaxID=112253 RepID=A0AA88RJZ2_9ASTE|nr:hypothetical protein RJ640_023678 [Escallonia rubra]